jgi:hypothetical protein
LADNDIPSGENQGEKEPVSTSKSPFPRGAFKRPVKTLRSGRAPSPKLPAPPTVPRFNCSEKQFFAYWKALPKEFLDNRVSVYVYRVWPELDYTLALTPEERTLVERGEQAPPPTNIDILLEPWEPENWEQEIYHRWGAGIYHFNMNDAGQDGKKLCQCTVRELTDKDTWPPQFDEKLLDLTHPNNASYIKWWRMKGGKLPDEITKESAVAESQAVAAMAQGMAQSNQILGELAKKASAEPAKKDPDPDGQLSAVQVVAEAGRQGIKFLSDAMTKANDTQAKTADPAEHLKNVIEIAKLLVPAKTEPVPSPDAGVVKLLQEEIVLLRKQVYDQQEARAKTAELALAAANQRATQVVNPVTGTGAALADVHAPKSLLAQIREAKGIAEELGWGGGSKSEGGPAWLGPVVQGLGMIGAMASNIVYNLAAAKMNAQPVPPPQQLAEAEQPEFVAGQQPGATAPAMDPNMTKTQRMMAFLQRLREPLIRSLDAGEPGYVFALKLAEFEGELAYAALVDEGKERILEALQLDPVIWGHVIQVPQRFNQFLDEFLSEEQVAQYRAELESQPVEEPQPPPRPVRVVRRVTPEGQAGPQEPALKGRTIVAADGKIVQTAPPESGGVV